MEYLESIILGVVQGLTEFLPISSSGHLEISKAILGNDLSNKESLLFTIVLHFATALSTLFFFRKDILNIILGLFDSNNKESKNFSISILISMIPAVFIGLFFEDFINSFFDGNLILVGCYALYNSNSFVFI
jgi:undecaprenyl-diphosphatase